METKEGTRLDVVEKSRRSRFKYASDGIDNHALHCASAFYFLLVLDVDAFPLRSHGFVNPRTARGVDSRAHVVFERFCAGRGGEDGEGADAWDVQG